jgi:hypothetical protein
MNPDTPENPEIPETSEMAPVSDEARETPVNPPQDIRRRLQQLLSIPERDRTDPQWDEIVELEIRLAPGNRADAGNVPGNNPPRRDNNNPGRGPAGQPKSRHPQKAHHFGGQGNKHRKPKPPQGSSQ